MNDAELDADSWCPMNHILCGGPDPPQEGALLGGHTWACPRLPAVNILNLFHKVAARGDVSVRMLLQSK